MSDLGWNQGQTTEPPVNDCYQAPVVAGHRSQTFHSPVPQEFRRQAKAFRGRVTAAGPDRQVIAVTESLTAYAKAIVTRRHTFRAEQLVEIERRWRAEVPDQFRCGLAIQRDEVGGDSRRETRHLKLSPEHLERRLHGRLRSASMSSSSRPSQGSSNTIRWFSPRSVAVTRSVVAMSVASSAPTKRSVSICPSYRAQLRRPC